MTGLIIAMAISIVPQPTEVWPHGGRIIPASSPVKVVEDSSIVAEGYWLEVGDHAGITIKCSDKAGEFYARQTLRQMLNWKGYPCATVVDSPAFYWRGMHFDDCRHFFGKEVLKKTIDIMAQYKLNVLHWHLTDDQGWRLDVPGYPDLVRYGAVRRASPRHGAVAADFEQGGADFLDGQRYGPFYYTESDVREIIEYAAIRHVTIVPEIELPGHVFAALAAYPEFACFPKNLSARSPRLVWGVEKDVLCLGNDRAIRFMEDVLEYVCRLFPSKVIHIGGDECPQTRWKECPKCQNRIKTECLGDEKELQPWITRHFAKFLAARGKRMIGWEEYLSGEGIPEGAMGMVWHDTRKGRVGEGPSVIEMMEQGHDVVMSPNAYCYFDYGQGLAEDPFQYFGGDVSLKKVYSLDPYEGISENLQKHVVGGQGNNWSEYTWNQYDLEWKMWPRGCALAEVFWCGKRKSAFDDFLGRMKEHRKRLVQQGVNCAPLW